MAETNPKVMAMIEAELAKDPSISNDELLAKAKKIDRSVGKLTARQFNARYPLQVKRRKDGPKPPKKTAKKGKTARAKKGKTARAKKSTRRAQSRKAPGKKTTGAGKGRKAAAGPAGGADRDAVRKVLLEYAKKVSAADSMTDMVDLVMDVDRYVDRVIKAAS